MRGFFIEARDQRIREIFLEEFEGNVIKRLLSGACGFEGVYWRSEYFSD